MADAFVIRWPHKGHPLPDGYGSTNGGQDGTSNAWLEDTRDGSCAFVDGMEPEDAILCRDLKEFVDLLNAEAAKVADLRAALRALDDELGPTCPLCDYSAGMKHQRGCKVGDALTGEK